MCSKIHGDKISGVIRKTNCGRRFTLLDLLVAEILQRGQPDERKVLVCACNIACNTACVCVCARSCTKNLINLWKGGECAIESSRSNLTLDEDDPSWFEAYRLTVWQVETQSSMQRVLQCPVQCFSEQNHKRHQDGLSWLNVRFSYYALDFNLS